MSFNCNDEDDNDNVNDLKKYFLNNESQTEIDITDSYEDIEKSRKEIVNDILSNLNKREIDIISKYFGLCDNKEMTLEEIGNIYGLTKERVRQIKEKALRKLRCCVLTHPDFSKIQSLK